MPVPQNLERIICIFVIFQGGGGGSGPPCPPSGYVHGPHCLQTSPVHKGLNMTMFGILVSV